MSRRGNDEMGRFSVEVELANYQDMLRAEQGTLAPKKVRRAKIEGVVDSGAARLVLPKAVADQLGLPVVGKTKVRFADHREATRTKVKDVWLGLLGRDGTFTAVVEPNRDDALIGAIVLEELDFVVDCITHRLHPRDPRWIITEIE